MNIYYKCINSTLKYNNWVILLELSLNDIPRVGKSFIIKVDDKIYTEPHKDLEHIVTLQELRK